MKYGTRNYDHPQTVRECVRAFLSLLADAYNKNPYWINAELRHWEEVFARVPPGRLNAWLDEYYQNEAGKGQYSGIPRLSEVKEWIKTRNGCDPTWFLRDRGVYCQHCRTNDSGTEGGMRVLWGRWWDQSRGKEVEETWSSRCDCPAAEGAGNDWRAAVKRIQAMDKDATIRYDRWDKDKGVKVRATDGGEHLWILRCKKGYVEIIEADDGSLAYSPVWEHPIWASSMGAFRAESLGWELPEEVQARARINAKRRAMGKPTGMKGWKPCISEKTIAWLRSMS